MTGRWKQFTRNNGERVRYQVTEYVDRIKTAYQLAEVLETPNYGRVFYLDHKVQSAEADEFIYHECLVHPALVAHPEPRRVFIAGGAEGATARHVLAHRSVEQVVMVDIDAEVVAFCRKHLPAWHQGVFDDPRLTLRHTDARRYLAETDERFDAILIDITDPLPGSPARLLFTSEFYQLAAGRLTDRGTLAVQAESGNISVIGMHLSIIKTLGTAFPAVRSYQANVPSYADAWAFGVAAKDPAALDLGPAEIDRRLADRGVTGLRFFDGPMYTALMTMPRYLQDRLDVQDEIITDAEPITVR